MLIEWLWKYEYFVNLRKMEHSTKHFNNDIYIYGNIMLLISWFSSPLSDVAQFVSLPSEGARFSSHTPIRGCLISFTPNQRVLDSFHLLSFCSPSVNNDGFLRYNIYNWKSINGKKEAKFPNDRTYTHVGHCMKKSSEHFAYTANISFHDSQRKHFLPSQGSLQGFLCMIQYFILEWLYILY